MGRVVADLSIKEPLAALLGARHQDARGRGHHHRRRAVL